MTVELSVYGRNVEVTQRLQGYVEKKTARLDRYLADLSEVRVDLSSENARNALERQIAQITIRDKHGTILRAEERSNDLFAAIDAVVDKLYRQIKRYRGKWLDSRRSGGTEQMLEALPIEDNEPEDETSQSIVRRKRFSLQPISSEEAVEQMELLGHDFFVFFNSEEEAINVVYRRRDGNFGLLQPDLD